MANARVCCFVRCILYIGQSPPRGTSLEETTDGPPLGDNATRKVDKGDQLSGGETAWTNTGATRSGRGQHKTG